MLRSTWSPEAHPVFRTEADTGYTGSACVAMAIDDAIEQKKIRAGSLVVMVGLGVGYNQAAAAFRM
jgi:3-oxoacyl-[acyl-carrier-protein] synthase-3